MSYWIQEAIKRPGSLTKWLKKHFGKKAFTKQGKIKITLLKKLAKKKKVKGRKIPKRVLAKINLAITLNKLRKKKSKRIKR